MLYGVKASNYDHKVTVESDLSMAYDIAEKVFKVFGGVVEIIKVEHNAAGVVIGRAIVKVYNDE